jgi:putative CocE/NonD family hydrolase
MDNQYVIHENQKVPCTKGLAPKDLFPGFDPTPRTFIDDGMRIEYNQPIKLRDGVQLRADLYFPENQPENVKLPIVLVFTPFGKKTPFDISKLPTSREFDPGYHGVTFSKYLIFEASDPAFWTKNGFAYVAVDSRGSFASEGEFFSFITKSDGRDACDVIEYLGERPWSNGRVGMIGASGLGHIQWYEIHVNHSHCRF